MSIFNRGAKRQEVVNQENNQQQNQEQQQVQSQENQNQQEQQNQNTPQFVTVDQFNSLQESINSLKDNFITAVGQRQDKELSQPQNTQTHIEDVSDEDYEKAVVGEITDRRQAAQIIQKRHKADIQRNNQELRQQIQELQRVGLGSIAGLTKQAIESMPHYKTYKKEIDTAINTLPPEQRVNSEAVKGVYSYVIGQHYEEILNAEKEAWIRQQQQNVQQQTTTKAVGGRQQTVTHNQQNQNTTAPDPSEVLDSSALEAIRGKYGIMDVDRFARSQGYKGGWEDMYNKVYKKIYESEGNA